MRQAPVDKVFVVVGGFANEKEVQCNTYLSSLDSLSSNHEEADTRLILHAIHSDASTIVARARDTDVLILLVAHAPKIKSTNIWMKSGTYKEPKYIPIRQLYENLSVGTRRNLVAFHALTGCDTI